MASCSVALGQRVEEEFAGAQQDAAGLLAVLHPPAGDAVAKLASTPAQSPRQGEFGSARLIDLFRETEAVVITLGAVSDEARPLLLLAGAHRDNVVGRMFGVAQSALDEHKQPPSPAPPTTPSAIQKETTPGLDAVGDGNGTTSETYCRVEAEAAPESTSTPMAEIEVETGLNPGTGNETENEIEVDLNGENLHPANGIESILCILVSLLRKLRRAIRQVIQVESNWLSSGLTNITQMSAIKVASCHDSMQLHHSQLKALYAIIHLCVAIVARTDTSKTLFLADSPEFEPSRWRSAVRMDDFNGRGFGFHYTPEMRNLLRVVKIAKGSVDKAALADITNPLMRNIAIMGWSWVYGHATILNNFGVPIQGIRNIGSDLPSGADPTVDHVRMFMNLVEDPFVAGASVLASADVATDRTFAIPPSSSPETTNPTSTEDSLRPNINQSINCRLISFVLRPTQLPSKANSGPQGNPPDKQSNKNPLSPNSPVKPHSIIDEALDGFQTLSERIDQFLRPESSTLASGLILHFHGGGFISQSSKSHAFYLHEWASDIPDSVILSVDYQLAPESQYPIALEECVYAYKWAVTNSQRLGSAATRVVLTGDSAGGNLAVAVAMKIIESGFRKPDGIVLAYPALFLTKGWSPSRLLSFFDPLLPVSVVAACAKWYIPAGADPEADPFLSPCIAKDSMLQALPSVSIVSGSLDPLLDDAVFFTHRMRAVGRDDARLRLAESMPHGFLNMSNVSPSAKSEMHNMARWMAQYLEVPFVRKNRDKPRRQTPPASADVATDGVSQP